MDFPVGASGKEPICQCRRQKRRGVAKSQTQLKWLSWQTYKTMDSKNIYIYMVLKTRMRAPKCHLSFSKERERKKSSYKCSNNNKKNRDGFAYKSSKAARRLIHPLRAPSHTDKQLPLLVIPQRLQSRLGWSGVEKMENKHCQFPLTSVYLDLPPKQNLPLSFHLP